MDALTTAAADATLAASRALLGVVARSVTAALDVVTLPQFRVLVVLSSAGPTRMSTLAERMGANPSTFSRSIDRMVAGGWVARGPSPESRREVLITLTSAGRELVDDVTERRRQGIAAILSPLTSEQQKAVRDALQLFADAAGETSASDLLTLGI
ncbi:MarR family transcriptional regulator [Cryobacterium sp. TMT2-18-3]|uniref:MarR family winged helix-turn-helix transcriptional regulator n=1 Tax=unclassified Cryobacterium TaxID=2649013 RepID=UPI00106CB69E|nr:MULTISPECIES: MarR family transcriptional regulator [unclassified Cryobacterium]TFC30535.1 MarR family transcriptional regulator [Cryobacterium sp. TMT2-18-2]TFC68247.1 MarR family transcriptional regulator [Cryobacterium sp. TMT2-18-3]